MLDKKDLQTIDKLLEKRLDANSKEMDKKFDLNSKEMDKRLDVKFKEAFREFYETLLLPYFEHNEKEHKEIREEIRTQVGELKEYIKDHEKRISKLESIASV